jgi:hypothetical protein
VLLVQDLSAVFDTVDHAILLRRLEQTFGVSDSGNVRNWLASYLSGRNYFVRHRADCSAVRQITSGVPQGSVLGPLCSSFCTPSIWSIQPNLHADDTQLHDNYRPGATSPLADRVARCVDLVTSWMRSNRGCALTPTRLSFCGWRQRDNINSPCYMC